MFRALVAAYRAHVTWEDWPALDARTAALLPGLLLARVDGKSPVEYVTEDRDREAISSFARAHLAQPPASLERRRSHAWSHDADHHHPRARPARLGLARTAHRRGRSPPRGRRHRARASRRRARRAARARPSTCATAARASAASTSRARSPTCAGRSRARSSAWTALEPGGHRREADRTGRHAEQGDARRQRDGGRVAGGRAGGRAARTTCRCGSISPATTPVSLPLPEIQIFGGGAHAGRRIDIQDLMVMPIGAWSFDDALTMVADIYRAAGALMAEAGKLAGVADEGGWWPQFAINEEALETRCARSSAPGYQPGQRRRDLARHRGIRVRSRRPLHAGARPARARPRRHVARCCCAGSSAFRSCRSRIRSPRTTARRGSRSRAQRAAPRADHRRRLPDDQCAERGRAGADGDACNAVLIKVNQAGTLTEAKAALDAGKARGIRHDRLGALGRNGGRRRSRTSRSAGTRASSRSARSRAASGRPSGTRCCGSRRRWARRALRGRRRAAAEKIMTRSIKGLTLKMQSTSC